MFAKNIVSKILSLSLLALLFSAGTLVSPVAAHGRDNKYEEYDSPSYSKRWSYARGFRDGYRAGFRDGRLDAYYERSSERVRSLRRVDPRSPYDRGFEVAYERGYRAGFNSISKRNRRDRDHDWDRDHKKRHGDDDDE